MSVTVSDAGKETPDQALARAQSAAQSKRFGEAGGICQDVLQASPNHPGAIALLGVIAAHTNQPERAIEFIERAIKLQANVPAWYANLCSLYRLMNRVQEAATAGRRPFGWHPRTLIILSISHWSIQISMTGSGQSLASSAHWASIRPTPTLVSRWRKTCSLVVNSNPDGLSMSGGTKRKLARAHCRESPRPRGTVCTFPQGNCS